MPYALPLYAVTLFISAFILFLVQPIVGKIILPKLGGTPQVWNTCMVFFQMMLLLGYAYTHNASTRLTLRQQLIAHIVLLCLPLIVLLPFPFAFGDPLLDELGRVTNPHSLWGFTPDLGSNPIPSTLTVLFLYVALPFVVVSTTAPLLQKWFVHTGHPASKDPYFLYGASNLGSMLSLILYPVLIEPLVPLQGQKWGQGWLYVFGYLALVAAVVICVITVWNPKDAALKPKQEVPPPEPTPPATPAEAQTAVTATAPAPVPAPATPAIKAGPPKHQPRGPQPAAPKIAAAHTPSDEMTAGRRLRWVLLTAIPSSLMLGVTTHITTDLSPMPLFWLIPLILYLASFILVFARWPVVWTEQPHVYFLYAQPVFLWLMIMTDVWGQMSQPAMIGFAIFAHVMGFFTTTMVCHGELAKDRPSTKHLTEFYLWMSVGGMCGGLFNALISPVIFTRVWEFPLAIFAAAIVRPKMFDVGLFDNWLAGLFEGKADSAPAHKPGHKGGGKPVAPVASPGVTANESFVQTLDFGWPALVLVLTALMAFVLSRPIGELSRAIVRSEDAAPVLAAILIFGVPLTLACLGLYRPLRIGLAVGAILLVHQVYGGREGDNVRTLVTSRSYFGAISVKETTIAMDIDGKAIPFKFNQLIHGHINHGMNFQVPENKKDRGHFTLDLSRLATTYYHREGPVGRVMEKYNWSPHKDLKQNNTFHADARIIGSLAGAMVGGDCLTSLVTAWSEPPIATVGLGTGTMASYGRPYQQVHFYEIDNQILRLSLTEQTSDITTWDNYVKQRDDSGKKTYFNYLEQAIERGATVQVLMGDARLRMALEYKNHYKPLKAGEMPGGGPDNFYHMMVVDAFSSDAIPAHLLTKQAFQVYFNKLTKRGVLCVHTSNRFVDLPKVVSAVAANLTYDEADLGFELADIVKDDLAALKLPDENAGAASIKRVEPGKAAEKAGLKEGDIVLRIDNSAPGFKKPARDLDEMIVDLEPGAKVKIDILRGDGDSRKPLKLEATLGKRTLNYKHLRGHDVNSDKKTDNRGHFTSEWVMVARRTEYILRDGDTAFDEAYKKAIANQPGKKIREEDVRYWDSVPINERYVWTDDYYNLLSVIRFRGD